MDAVVHSMVESLQNTIPPQVVVFIISVMPVLELRGGLLASFALGMPWLEAYIICVIATILPTPFILLFINKIFAWMKKKSKRLGKIALKMEEKGRKGGEKVKKYEKIGLLIFVAIPLPGTGAWTGTLAAAILEMKLKDAMLPIILGTMIAGLLMLILGYGILGNIF